ncbi:hypothetical protein [Pontibacter harenae]|uniref:hypothetical protein n=1 Tax=Pontibacter harenae TaxID=2894083 RepID=UPI001E338329|nr:hypothetical protein [Pontibacter harenae]MCC9165984.1 hypothetical protein [Pontibacter harenae]
MLIKLFTLYVYLQAALCGCGSDRRNSDFVRLRKNYKVKVQRIGKLNSNIPESSGLARASDSSFWTHGDSGSPSEFYLFNLKGELLQTLPLQLKNQDWEDLAQDEQGELYIGDFGNNENNRQNLQVHQLRQETGIIENTIRFRYADQTEFPPPSLQDRHYDLEGFFYHADSLHLFTKSRALRHTITRHYRLPTSEGNYTLEPQEELRVKSAITGADISDAKDQFALLGYGRLYLFQMEEGQVSFSGKRSCLPIGKTGQAEAVLYLSPTQLLITNENGKFYLVTLEER